MAQTSKRKCTCEHKYQDKKYKGKRVMNKTANGWNCTVCNKDHRSAQPNTCRCVMGFHSSPHKTAYLGSSPNFGTLIEYRYNAKVGYSTPKRVLRAWVRVPLFNEHGRYHAMVRNLF